MKPVWVLVFLAVCSVVVVSFQAIQQEINIRKMRQLINLNTQEVKTKEDEILISKAAMQKLSSQLVPLDKQKIQLTKKMDELVRERETSGQNLETCQTQKKESEEQKAVKSSEFDALRTNHNAEIQKVQEEVQSLQKQILERDTKICLYVDKDREEARALCKDKAPASNS
ncbi:hypothetical protein KOW79_000733 [Hemibagrus wyckioides]|uniref:Uncharacterized protein n=1 Tax=Hemibagrus wyckioides TaxID=337641 RepID=A0A9D3P767_9TELE|nr:uncharacterized protein si:dkey-87o1.2 [Hemibagrus wyckioides]KAG7336040.1 hypothetical protein KOW79_000733 [Hemibagrus wyckioides]